MRAGTPGAPPPPPLLRLPRHLLDRSPCGPCTSTYCPPGDKVEDAPKYQTVKPGQEQPAAGDIASGAWQLSLPQSNTNAECYVTEQQPCRGHMGFGGGHTRAPGTYCQACSHLNVNALLLWLPPLQARSPSACARPPAPGARKTPASR